MARLKLTVAMAQNIRAMKKDGKTLKQISTANKGVTTMTIYRALKVDLRALEPKKQSAPAKKAGKVASKKRKKSTPAKAAAKQQEPAAAPVDLKEASVPTV